ncbi:MAG: hypothetical protein R3B46_09770 [Phycisphaerales bacterium]
MEADFTSKGLEEAAEILRLDDDQKMIAEELLKGYLVEWEELRGRMNQVMEGCGRSSARPRIRRCGRTSRRSWASSMTRRRR